ncbi:MAG: virulence protein, SciE type [Psychromonas sp.]|nr:virulence protein, SciE type [Psychromonas sp.]
MSKENDMLQEGKLTEAIEYLETELKDDPLNTDYRSSLIEMLCIIGDLERADAQLDIIALKNPQFTVGATNLRQLLRAQQSRLDFINGKSVPELFNGTTPYSEALVKLNIELHNGDDKSINDAVDLFEEKREKIGCKVNDKEIKEFRDLDDTLGSFIEIFTTDGKYYLADLSDIQYIIFKPIASTIERVWRRVELCIKNGSTGEAHIPIVYANSKTDAQKLGRETDWIDSTENVSIGLGLKTWFADDNLLVYSEMERIDSLT